MAETKESVKKINKTIIDFVRYHPDNIMVWSDNGKLIIQLSNISVRDKGLRYASFIANGTTLEDDFEIFGLPCKCTYASDSVLRFEGDSKAIVKSFENGEVTPDKITVEGVSEEVKLSIIKKFTTRVVNSKAFYREMEKVTKEEDPDDGSTVKIYVIGNPQQQHSDDPLVDYVTWKVLGILKINAGTTWGDSGLREQVMALKGEDISSDVGSFGSFNVAVNDPNLGNVYEESDNSFDGKIPQFYLDDSVQVGDTIDSRDYHDTGLWNSAYDYQTNVDDYQTFNNGITIGDVNLADTMIYDGSVITV